MSLVLVGLNHQRASIQVRERLTLSESSQRRVLDDAARGTELLVLCTCNRTEVYAGGVPPHGEAETSDRLVNLLAAQTGVPVGDFLPLLYRESGDAAIRHLCRVASGLDSMVPGESEILGQVTQAYAAAASAGAVGPELARAFQAARRAGRRVRTETELGRRSTSVGSEAARLLEEALGTLAGRSIVVIGTGKMGRLAGLALAGRDAGARLSVVSRTADRATELAAQIGARPLAWSDLNAAIRDADAILTATAAPHAVITREMVERAIGTVGDGRARVIVDVAVPRDVEPEVRSLPGVTVFDLDDVQRRIARNVALRLDDAPAADDIVEEEMEYLGARTHEAALKPLLSDMRARGDEIRRREIARLWRRLGDVPPDLRDEIEAFSESLLNKLLHEPTRTLRETRDPDKARTYTDVTRVLFGLVPPESGGSGPSQ